ncbi:hypothetical protein F3157_06895 [Virgibacillus dakarensis]|uniref:DUF5325 family protein n=1 Tax=Lentibacillus populi TaxID=1827502 RepID=A0A9W5U203_9BACI|nr:MULTISPECIES: DUF5325 family protein [Bacillaceae]MBT2216174.1 DUF5325 family protein [Virgibacillus dakarensis]MTW85387.1 hypothetical protein [Virgibacillus dakarensis]GGB63599.1 hypothetical protein GCM10011409_45830 [Lentibacillus populi]
MKNINLPMLLLATLVIAMFLAVGVAISYHNIWFVLLFILLGFATMGLGLTIKRKRSGSQ